MDSRSDYDLWGQNPFFINYTLNTKDTVDQQA